jgi:hypothetical protein
VGRPTPEKDINYSLVAGGVIGFSFGSKQVGQRKRTGSYSERADFEELPPRHTVTIPASLPENREHG